VPEDEVTLDALGIRLDDEDEAERLRIDCIPVARRVAHAHTRIVGLFPASAEVGVPAVGVQLGLALMDVTGAPVAFVDANVRWPAISRIAVGTRTDDDESLFATRWLRGHLALLTPPRAAAAGAGLPQLARLIQRGGELFAHLEMMDGVVVVARAGVTRETELLRLGQELPAHLGLGVLLTGVRRK
jgi:hypothetical protein